MLPDQNQALRSKVGQRLEEIHLIHRIEEVVDPELGAIL